MARTPPRSATHSNPYAADGAANNYGLAVAAGADPANYSDSAQPQGSGNHFWSNGDGWAPGVTHNDYAGTPDPTRVEELPRTDRRANLRAFWAWWTGIDAETARRESVTTTQAIGFAELKGVRTRAPHPLWTPPPEPRPSGSLSPHTYVFSRPFDQDVMRMGNRGAHMSLADNRRNYPILVQSPIPNRRNTYRVEPTPWDQDIVDTQTATETGKPSERLQSPDIPISTYRRNYRTGG